MYFSVHEWWVILLTINDLEQPILLYYFAAQWTSPTFKDFSVSIATCGEGVCTT